MMYWDELERTCKDCRRCQLAGTRNNVVFGVGKRDADIMFVGEGPGEQEDLKGEPFVGAAGHLLDDMLSIIDLDRTNSYIANIVKCRPPRNRDPEPVEQDACIGYLLNQIDLIRPKVIVCLGRVAAKKLISEDYRNKNGIWVTSIYHPSALLRDLGKRPETFEDLLSIRQKLIEVQADIRKTPV